MGPASRDLYEKCPSEIFRAGSKRKTKENYNFRRKPRDERKLQFRTPLITTLQTRKNYGRQKKPIHPGERTMGTEVQKKERPKLELQEWGPKMRVLNDMQRKFVLALLSLGPGGNNQGRAAREAGYSGGPDQLRAVGCRLAHNRRVSEAIQEEAKARLASGSIAAASYVLEAIADPTISAKDRLAAAIVVMNRTGMHAMTESKVTVEHSVDPKELEEKIRRLAGELGQDATKLLENAGFKTVPGAKITDAEFEELPRDEPEPAPRAGTDGLEDLL